LRGSPPAKRRPTPWTIAHATRGPTRRARGGPQRAVRPPALATPFMNRRTRPRGDYGSIARNGKLARPSDPPCSGKPLTFTW
jgi:hypothetical protein